MSGERRAGGDRRRGSRPGTAGRRRDDILFAGDSVSVGVGTEDSFFDPGWLAAGDLPRDSRMLRRQVRRIAAAQDSALARVYRTYAAARAAIGAGLVLVQGLTSLIGVRAGELTALICLVYAVQAVTLWLLPRFRPPADGQALGARRRRLWLSTVGVDLVAFSALHLLEAGTSFNYAALLVLPVLMAGVLTSRLMALGTAAAVALMLLAVAWRAAGIDTGLAGLMLQSGLAGLGLFVITLLSGELAGRLAREELAARGSLELARQQAQLNRLVIEEMVDGVLVVDRRLRVRAANPAARTLLVDQGLSPPAPFGLDERPAWSALRSDVERALAEGHWPEAGRDVTVDFGGRHLRTLRLRVRFMRRGALADDPPRTAVAVGPEDERDDALVVLLLEDVRTALARVRQEKLAAMGRISAGIAHEIRNPLSAIAQANALLMEDELTPGQQRLVRIVADNARRLGRLVDDVMEVAPGAAPALRAVDARAAVAAIGAEWAQTAGIAVDTGPDAASRLRLELEPGPLGAVFDPEHLRRVLVNLLDNAHRHASDAPGSIAVRLGRGSDGRVALAVLSDGDPIPPETERLLFEPFMSTRSRGTGLGLYICRELCERYGAGIEYRSRPSGERLRNEFVVSMRRAVLADTAPPPAAS
ncbi:MAG: histidine kinase [Burkholderiales bacterium]|nr:histidine kinase [Burkholderiales bacterium]